VTERIDFVARGGRPVVGELVRPAGDGRAPGVIVIHEWWGLNDSVRRTCTRLGAEGFLALAVDLYDGRVTADAGVARAYAEALRTPDAVDVVAGAADRLRSHARGNGTAGVIGFCLGGAMALAAACAVDALGAVVPFYGIPLAKQADWSRLSAPVLAHFGTRDPYVPDEKVDALEVAMRAAGVDLTLHRYDAGHAFMRLGDDAYDETVAPLAWARTVDFLRLHLGTA
jgi:carboxymethylenebutenolidase